MDSWKHRITAMKCKTCMWFLPKEIIDPSTPAEQKAQTMPPPVNVGRCRRHSPTMNGYPVVFVNDWCGDHKLDENCV